MDGTVNQATSDAIGGFQGFGRGQGWKMAVDYRVDPPTGELNFASITQTQYTIVYLNMAYGMVRSDWPEVGLAPDCPSELRSILRTPKFVW